MKILITGADGFIGSHLTEMLVTQGHEIIALSQYNSFNNWGWLEDVNCKSKIKVLAGDIRDPHYCKYITKDVDIIFHLAALIAIPYSYVAPDSYVDTNIKGTLNICQAAKENGNIRLIHTSTSEVYGTAQYVPIDENHPMQPQSPYSATKIAADAMAMSFYNAFGLPVTIARPFNTYGPRMHPDDGRVVSNFIVRALRGEPLAVYGDGNQTRSFCYVDDLVKALITFMGSEPGFTGPVNLGNPSEFTIKDLAQQVISLTGSTSKIAYGALPEDDPKQRQPDISLAQKALDWQPEIPLDTGLPKTIEYFKQILGD